MTTFTGKLLEYPYISIDRFNGENLSSSVYFLSHCHKDHMEGLLDDQFLRRLKSGYPDVKFYASETTCNLMSCDSEMKKLLNFVIGLPTHQTHHLKIKTTQDEVVKEENFAVTLISAGHCVGSVIKNNTLLSVKCVLYDVVLSMGSKQKRFLFEGKNGKVLYTGDFRLNEKNIKKIDCLHTNSSVAHIKSVYVDTTFCCPHIPELPTREETKKHLIEVIRDWIKKGPEHVVHLKCKGRYGYEYILKEVSKYFQMKIHVNDWRLAMSAKLPNMLKHFTTDGEETQIHSCYFGKGSNSSNFTLPCNLRSINNRPIQMITVVPSSLFFVQSKQLPKDGRLWIKNQKLWRVVHSMHASYNEIREVVGYLKPENIFPCVPPVDCPNIICAYNRLRDLECCSSSSSVEFDEREEKQNVPPTQQNNGSWSKDLLNKNMLSPKSGFSFYESIGLTTEDSLRGSPPPMRKRRKKLNVTNERTQKEVLCDDVIACRSEKEVESVPSKISQNFFPEEQHSDDQCTTLPAVDQTVENIEKLQYLHHPQENDDMKVVESNSVKNLVSNDNQTLSEKKVTCNIIVVSDDDSDNDSDRTLSFSEASGASQEF